MNKDYTDAEFDNVPVLTESVKTGIELIADERQRQIEVEGWTPEHDAAHKDAELLRASLNYTDLACFIIQTGRDDAERYFRGQPPDRSNRWPWDVSWWKPDWKDPIRNLVKAGALIAAEIDRIQRLKR